jgi:hypothetical protein
VCPVGRTGFDFSDSYHGRNDRLLRNKAMGGVEASLGSDWELRAADFADLLNQARARWAGTAPARRT